MNPNLSRSTRARIPAGTTLAGLALLATAGMTSAATIVVNVGTDPIDIDWQTATIADLPGPDGNISLSEAFIASNNTPGHDTIEFALPQSEWQLQWLLPGRAVIWSSYTYYWRSFDEVTVDGTTQTDFTGDTNPDGAEVAFYGGEIYLNGDNSTLKGIDGGALSFSGSNGFATENTGDINLTFYGGSGSLIQNNQIGTLKLDRSSDNVVVGNTIHRVRNLGGGVSGQENRNNRIGGPNPEDRNYLTGYGYVNSEGLPAGHAIQMFYALDTLIENNYIGTTVDGMDHGNSACTMGIRFEGENSNTTIRNNLISNLGRGQGPHYAGYLFGWGIFVSGGGDGLRVVGNRIGLDAAGEPSLGSVVGIDIGTSGASTMTGIQVGGLEPGDGNTIAGHRFNGISVGRTMNGVRICGNSIYANDDLGIDLITDGYDYGVTPNDEMDTDSGGNGLQNFPVIANAMSSGSSVHVTGSLHSTASSEFTLDFFASSECDETDHGEGEVYLGSESVVTDTDGNAEFDVVLSGTVEDGWVLTSTATLEPIGDTSEFSLCALIETEVASVQDETVASTGPRLFPSSPNPFRTSSTIRYELPASGLIQLRIYDAGGRLVRTLAEGTQAAGSYSVVWNGRDEHGRVLTAGVYFYELRLNGQRTTRQTVIAG